MKPREQLEYPAKAMSIVSISKVVVCRGNGKNSSSRSGLGETNLSVVVVGNGVREQAISWQRRGRWTAQTRRFGSSVEGLVSARLERERTTFYNYVAERSQKQRSSRSTVVKLSMDRGEGTCLRCGERERERVRNNNNNNRKEE